MGISILSGLHLDEQWTLAKIQRQTWKGCLYRTVHLVEQTQKTQTSVK